MSLEYLWRSVTRAVVIVCLLGIHAPSQIRSMDDKNQAKDLADRFSNEFWQERDLRGPFHRYVSTSLPKRIRQTKLLEQFGFAAELTSELSDEEILTSVGTLMNVYFLARAYQEEHPGSILPNESLSLYQNSKFPKLLKCNGDSEAFLVSRSDLEEYMRLSDQVARSLKKYVRGRQTITREKDYFSMEGNQDLDIKKGELIDYAQRGFFVVTIAKIGRDFKIIDISLE